MKIERHASLLGIPVLARAKFVENIVGDVTGGTAARSAAKLGKRSVALQERQYGDTKEYYDKLAAEYKAMVADGFFNPTKEIGQYDKEFGKSLDTALTQSAVADRVAGDTSGWAGKRRNTITALALSERARDVLGIARKAVGDRFSYLLATRPDTQGATNALSSTLAGQAEMYRQQAGAAAGNAMRLFGALAPMFKGKGGNGGGSQVPA